jgi:hypothetical protein
MKFVTVKFKFSRNDDEENINDDNDDDAADNNFDDDVNKFIDKHLQYVILT